MAKQVSFGIQKTEVMIYINHPRYWCSCIRQHYKNTYNDNRNILAKPKLLNQYRLLKCSKRLTPAQT